MCIRDRVIEVILFEELVAAVLQSAFPPVLFPKDCTGIKGGCPFSRFVYPVSYTHLDVYKRQQYPQTVDVLGVIIQVARYL